MDAGKLKRKRHRSRDIELEFSSRSRRPEEDTVNQIIEYRSLFASIEFQQTKDLRYVLAAKSHASNAFLSQVADPQPSINVQDSDTLHVLRNQDDKLSTFWDPSVRWPLAPDQVPIPSWSLGEEIEAVIQKRYRQMKCNASNSSTQGSEPETCTDAENPSQSDDDDGDQLSSPTLSLLSQTAAVAVQARLQSALEHISIAFPKRARTSQANHNPASQHLLTPRCQSVARKVDWTNVIGALQLESNASTSLHESDRALDHAITASVKRLKAIYGNSDYIQLLAGPKPPFACKNGSLQERLSVLNHARQDIFAQISKRPWQFSHPHPSRKELLDQSILDPLCLITDHYSTQSLKPPPIHDRPETWPVPKQKSNHPFLSLQRASDEELTTCNEIRIQRHSEQVDQQFSQTEDSVRITGRSSPSNSTEQADSGSTDTQAKQLEKGT